jgi:NADPH-dependent curcumin reductase CurA
MPDINRQIVLRSRPVGAPTPDNFELKETPLPRPGAGEFLGRTIYLSLDPYMRGRMNDVRSYAPSVQIGQPMVGGTVSEVVDSNHPGFARGDIVANYNGWQAYGVSNGAGVRKVDPAQGPISTALGVLGMPGMTAYVGLLDIGQPKPAETVVVSAAAGAVGSVVGQIAKIKGGRAVGIAGGPDKCRHVVEDLGFDVCVDYQRGDFVEALQAACPKGIDVYFENVGGAVLAAVLRFINPFARIPLCGLISQYNATALPAGPNLGAFLINRITLKGFIVSDHLDRLPHFLRDCAQWVREGKLKYREDVVEGLENAPAAFIGLLRGKNLGKMLVKVGAPPAR